MTLMNACWHWFWCVYGVSLFILLKPKDMNLQDEKLMLMSKDGVHIYRYDAAIRNRLLWRKVKRPVTPERVKKREDGSE
jgi:hypothetical protein